MSDTVSLSDGNLELIESRINEAKLNDGANAAILGCAAFSGMGKKLTERCGIYVSDGICESIFLAKSLSEIRHYR